VKCVHLTIALKLLLSLGLLYLLATHLALDELPGKRGNQREDNGVREVDRHRRATRREAEEDTGDEEVEERNKEEKLHVHLFTFR
jgi:hypothetical protein